MNFKFLFLMPVYYVHTILAQSDTANSTFTIRPWDEEEKTTQTPTIPAVRSLPPIQPNGEYSGPMGSLDGHGPIFGSGPMANLGDHGPTFGSGPMANLGDHGPTFGSGPMGSLDGHGPIFGSGPMANLGDHGSAFGSGPISNFQSPSPFGTPPFGQIRPPMFPPQIQQPVWPPQIQQPPFNPQFGFYGPSQAPSFPMPPPPPPGFLNWPQNVNRPQQFGGYPSMPFQPGQFGQPAPPNPFFGQGPFPPPPPPQFAVTNFQSGSSAPFDDGRISDRRNHEINDDNGHSFGYNPNVPFFYPNKGKQFQFSHYPFQFQHGKTAGGFHEFGGPMKNEPW